MDLVIAQRSAGFLCLLVKGADAVGAVFDERHDVFEHAAEDVAERRGARRPLTHADKAVSRQRKESRDIGQPGLHLIE